MTTEIFCRILQKECAVAPGAHVLCAVSGGADSVALLCLLCQARESMGIRVCAAHVEHGIRGQKSLEDMEFVRALCMQMKVDCHIGRVDAPAFAKEKGCGLEAAARELRYAFLEETRERIGADVIAVAHHGGDQAETVLMHAVRGSDLRGLCAMLKRRGVLIRPLLDTTPSQLRAYLQSNGQTWREDDTNSDPAYARNRIRSQVLPQLERAYPGAGSALTRLSRCAQRDEDYFSRQIAELDIRLIPLADGAALEVAKLRTLHEALLSRILVRLLDAVGAQASHLVIDWLISALKRGEASAALGMGSLDGQALQARFGKRYLCVTRPYLPIGDVPLCLNGETRTPMGVFHVGEALPSARCDGITCQIVPSRLLEGAVVSIRREGDAMIPFGQHSPVKIKKLLIDCGVERAMRRSIPVVRGAQGILWLPGIRPAQACRAQEDEERRMITFCRAECVKLQ